MKARRTLLSLAIALWVSMASVTPANAQSDPVQAADPVVNDVVRMLEVGIESDLVLQWLKSSGKQPGPLSADDVIALTQAKAPKELIQALLDMSARPATPPPQTHVPPPAPAGPAPAAPGSTVPVAGADGECCLVHFTVEYRVAEDVIGDNTAGPERDLFVYVDGRFLARFASQGNIAARGPIPFKARLAPGDHTLRVTRELHTRTGGRRDDGKWEHETTASPVAIAFAIDGSANWNLDLRWTQSEFSVSKPLSWQLSRNGVEVAGEKKTGAFKDDWPYVCEDVEVSRDNGALSGWRTRDRLKNCVTWASLWPAGAPTRQSVLAELAESDFEPTVGTVGRID